MVTYSYIWKIAIDDKLALIDLLLLLASFIHILGWNNLYQQVE